LKWLSIIDECTRECLALEVNRSITAEKVIDVLAELFRIRGVPKHIRSDNGAEFIAKAIRRWRSLAGVETLYVEPGSPWENGHAESLHSRLRDELINREEFTNLAEVRHMGGVWCLELLGALSVKTRSFATPSFWKASSCRLRSWPPVLTRAYPTRRESSGNVSIEIPVCSRSRLSI
jgi:transposase InsO family protein